MPSIINKSIDLSRTTRYRLSIHAFLNGFSFAVLDEAASLCRQLHYYAFSSPFDHNDVYTEMTTSCRNHSQLKYNYSTAQCVFCSPSFTLVPHSLFVPEKAAAILKSIHTINELDEVYFHDLPRLGVTCVYSIPNAITAPLLKNQPATRFFPIASSLIQMVTPLLGHTRILFFYWDSFLYLTLMKEQQLLLCNAFHAPDFHTALYFLFLVLHQWQLNPDSLRLYISGEITKQNRKMLHNYFPSVVILFHEAISLPNLEHTLRFGTILHHVCE